MKRLVLLLLIALLYNFKTVNAQNTVNEGDIIKDENGKVINFKVYKELMDSGDWNYTPTKDKDGKPYFQLHRMSDFEKQFRAKILKQQKEQAELIGKKAPDFEFTDINGNKLTSVNTKGKIVVLNFWFIACKPCIEEIPELNAVHTKYKGREDIVFASITFDRKQQVETFLAKTPIKYNVVPDSRTTIDTFNIFAYPTNIIIDKNGNFADIKGGGFSGIGEHIKSVIEKTL